MRTHETVFAVAVVLKRRERGVAEQDLFSSPTTTITTARGRGGEGAESIDPLSLDTQGIILYF